MLAKKALLPALILNSTLCVQALAKGGPSQDQSTNFQTSSIGAKRLMGPLKNYKLPEYSGPVSWGSYVNDNDILFLSLGAVAATGLLGYAVGSKGKRKGRSGGPSFDLPGGIKGALIGGVVGGLGSFSCMSSTQPASISFDTKVEAVLSASPATTIITGTGKSKREVGPVFPQTVTIPECTAPLAAGQVGAPFIEGQNIRVTFFFNKRGSIISWNARPVIERPES